MADCSAPKLIMEILQILSCCKQWNEHGPQMQGEKIFLILFWFFNLNSFLSSLPWSISQPPDRIGRHHLNSHHPNNNRIFCEDTGSNGFSHCYKFLFRSLIICFNLRVPPWSHQQLHATTITKSEMLLTSSPHHQQSKEEAGAGDLLFSFLFYSFLAAICLLFDQTITTLVLLILFVHP